MNDLIVALDIDSTVFDLFTPWLKWLREVHGVDLSVSEITRWDWDVLVPPGMRIYDYLHREDAFINMLPLPGAVQAIQAAHNAGVRQFFLTKTLARTDGWQKHELIKKWFPELSRSVITTSGDKDVVRADILVDDAAHNLIPFAATGGLTCKIPYGYNRHFSADYTMTAWTDYAAILKDARRRKGVRNAHEIGGVPV